MYTVDYQFVYKMIQNLIAPFTSWKAYKAGIIDEHGNILVHRDDFHSREQHEAFTLLDQLMLNIKKMLAKLPPSQTTKLMNINTALWMIRETNCDFDITAAQVAELTEKFSQNLPLLSESMTAGAGGIAGIGIGPAGEPGLSVAAQRSYTWANSRVFVVPTDKFLKSRFVKNPHHKYSKYVGDDEEGEEIRQFGRSNPNTPIILQDKQTGAMMYLRHGRQK
jgi:hypothetical protein